MITRAEPSGAPSQAAFPGAAPDAGFQRFGDHLLEGRIARERVRQIAWIIRIGATELDGGGRAASLGVAEIQVHGSIRAVGNARRGIKPVAAILPSERTGAGGRADPVPVIYGGAVVAAGDHEVPRISDRKCIDRVDAPSLWQSMEIDAGVHRRPVVGGRAVLVRVHGSNR